MFNNELYFYYDKEDGLFVDCKYCYFEENDRTVKKIVNINGAIFIDVFQECKYCGTKYYRDKQVDNHLQKYKQAVEFDKIRWL